MNISSRSAWAARKPRKPAPPVPVVEATDSFEPMSVDRTAKLYIGGKQARPGRQLFAHRHFS